MLFGLDSESYRKSVYIPQGEIETDGLQGDLKARLLALLNTGGVGDNGAERALEKLDAADRALRAKRKPAKGKLDEIDEKLAYISAQKADCERYGINAEKLRGDLAGLDNDIAFYNEQIRKAEENLEYASRQSELAFKRDAYAQTQEQLANLQAQGQQLTYFFNGIEPATVNLEGITQGVNEFYAVKERVEKAQADLNAIEGQYQEMLSVRSKIEQLEGLEKTYEEILDSDDEDDGEERAKRGKKIVPKMRKAYALAALLGLLVAIVGAVLIDSMPKVGWSVAGAGVVIMLIVFLMLMPKRQNLHRKKRKKGANRSEVIEERLYNAQTERKKQEKLLSTYPKDLETQRKALVSAKGQLQAELTAREQGICNFLSNFRFEETYDYRAAVNLLQNRISAYQQFAKQVEDGQKRLNDLEQDMQISAPSQPTAYSSIGELRAQKDGLTNQKEELLSRRARAISDAEEYENRSDKRALTMQEESLLVPRAKCMGSPARR